MGPAAVVLLDRHLETVAAVPLVCEQWDEGLLHVVELVMLLVEALALLDSSKTRGDLR